MTKQLISLALLSMLSACNAPAGTINPEPSPTPTPSSSAPGSEPSLVAPAGQVKLIPKARCEEGSIWVLPQNEEIAVAPCPPPESQPALIEPALSQQIPESRYQALKAEFNLLSVYQAPEYLGSLKPTLPMATGLLAQCSQNQGVVYNGGMLGSCSQYLVDEEGKTRILKDKASFSAYFAPIESAAEAASYAIARTGDRWLPNFPDLSPDFRYYQRLIQRSRVEEAKNGGYDILLYHYEQFGCGPHPYLAVKYHVSRDGNLSELSRSKAWADPNQDGLCVD